VATALAGVFADPRALPGVTVEEPQHFDVDDSQFLFRETAGIGVAGTVIQRGPNVGEAPRGTPVAENLAGIVAIKVGDKITTDHIMPAGQRLKYRSNVPAYAKYVFEGVDPIFATRAAANRDAGLANVIVAGESYGQGSSREHAALCPMYLGVRAVVCKSMERIHNANLVNFGIVPFTFENPADYDAVDVGDALEIPGLAQAIAGGGKAILRNLTKNKDIPLAAELSARAKAIVLAGGLMRYVAQQTK
jgi:aconitate hydratase